MTIYAVVLAGGQGSRLGDVRKAEIRLGGRSLLERVMERLPTDVLISTGHGRSYSKYTCVSDGPGPVGGPLAGLAAAVLYLRDKASSDDVLISAAVDTPFLPADFAHKLIGGLAFNLAAYAIWGDEVYPTNAAYRFGAIATLPERLAELGSPKRLQAALHAQAVRWETDQNPFANLNTLADLVTLARRAE
ncbi:molybdenum cofactor guanylyltransferase [Devosia rhizoryzae]|uniref:Molybdenum cofactor guanylyltransferase n=1 Tax=Devosia rhizoryzae TaxID=2774137 RepID=A0ABX7C9Q8_9HYPH|nr:molybdenum cofactor guanylyltransferase [Devosia rhizoryzae]QQR40836.1 molybdenum cofactor guanylyltransferase [Devosia rhizoryzae]